MILRKDKLRDGKCFIKTRYTSPNITSVLPTLFDDIQLRMAAWGSHGVMDPFVSIYDVRHMLSPCLFHHDPYSRSSSK